MKYKLPLFLITLFFITINTSVKAAPAITNISDNKGSYPGSNIPKYNKYEIKFDITGTTAGNFFLPYDTNLPSGMDTTNPKHKGISVDAVFSQDNFVTSYKVPAFYQKEFTYRDNSGNLVVKNNQTWAIPTGRYVWTVRFSPNKIGTWQYKITATDSSGTTNSSTNTFNVVNSSKKGFIKVSSSDSRYFEFEDGTPFLYQGIQDGGKKTYAQYNSTGINFLRTWWNGNYGSAWGEWTAGNQYIGYLPRTMLYPIVNPSDNRQILTTRIDYDSDAPSNSPDDGTDGWFDACIVGQSTNIAVNQNTNYKYQITYLTKKPLVGPRVAGKPYGIVGKLDNGGNSWGCWESGTGQVITGYGASSSTFVTISGNINSGTNNFLPRILVGLENVIAGEAEIYDISIRQDLGNGQFGPEMMPQYNSDFHLYINENRALDGDIALEEAEKNNEYLKIVLLEKEDKMWKKINNDGSFTINMADSLNGFYGLGRSLNMTRYLQAAYFRYIQARYGYSTNVHSFELLNEGDPGNSNHFALTDEMGKYFRCRIFGVSVPFADGVKCNYNHPNSHLTTTSFWHSFPMDNFWASTLYPNVSYADIHAYNSTSTLPITDCDKNISQNDAAYYHLCHSKALYNWGVTSNLKKPIVRGEAGIDKPDNQCTNCIGIENDTTGVWLQTYLWSTLDFGALYEMYWWYGEHIATTTYDNSSKFKNLINFISGIPLNNGNYKDLAASISNTQIQVIGQKDTANQNAHFWARHTGYTWKNVVDNVSRTAQSGTVTITGFTPNKSFKLEEWNTQTGAVKATSTISANASGNVIVNINSLTTDTAFKIINTAIVTPQISPSTTPSVSINPKFDVNKDGFVNLLDVIAVLGEIFK